MAPKAFFLNAISKSQTITGLEAIFGKDERITFNVVLIKRERTLFKVIQSCSGLGSLDELMIILDKYSPVILTISGYGILHKKTENNSTPNLLNSFNKTFPHSNPKEFYIQQATYDENNFTYTSIIRRSQLDSLLNKLPNVKIINVVFGPFAMKRLLPIMESSAFINGSINIGHYQFSFNNSYIENISWAEDSESRDRIRVGDSVYDSSSLIPYASVLNYYAPGNLITEAEIESITLKNQDFGYEMKFKKIAIVLAVTFFSLLLVNFLLFNSYFSRSNDLKQSLSVNSRSIAELDSLKKELDSHKQILTNYNFKGMSKTSYYADRIAASVPHSIALEELYLFPLKKSDTGSEDLLFDNKKILIIGYSLASIELNEWIKQLQKNSWTGKVNILSYIQSGAKDKGKFSIEVELL